MTFWQALFDRIGHLLEIGFDAAWRAIFGNSNRDPELSEAFTVGVIALGAKLAKADGRVTRDEITAFKQVFHVPPEAEKNVGQLFNLARKCFEQRFIHVIISMDSFYIFQIFKRFN